MDKIVCLVGESGSGKSTIAELLEKEGYNYIQSYTTRPQRYEGEKGHIFVKEFLCDKQNIIAYTYFDNAHYWATKEQYRGKGTSIYIIDPVGVKELKEKVKDADVVVIYLKVNEDIRYNRMFNRDTDISKVKERINHDRKAFEIVECNYVIDANRQINEVLKDIKTLI